MRQLLAAILTDFNRPLSLDYLEAYSPSYGQALVSVVASGICGAQLAEIRGDKNPDMPLPRLLGHEGIGIVEEVGQGVKRVKPGDRVCMHWRRGDGVESEPPLYVKDFASYLGSQKASMTAGKVVTFATHSVCSENRLTPVPEDTPDELAMLLGCSLSTALGVVENEADVKFGESVLIIGCGGLGLNLILAAKLRQAGRIYAMDIHPEKEAMALAMGATAYIDARIRSGSSAGMPQSPDTTLRWSGEPSNWTERKYPSDKCDVVIDTSGDSRIIGFTLSQCLAPSGRFVMVGQPRDRVMIEFPQGLFAGSGQTIRATQGGRFNPSVDIPRYVAAWRAGRLNLDGLISHRLPLSQINDGLDLVRNGQAGRILIQCADQ